MRSTNARRAALLTGIYTKVLTLPYNNVLISGQSDVFRPGIPFSRQHCRHLTEQSMAAVIDAGLPVSEPVGSMVVDIGEGRRKSPSSPRWDCDRAQPPDR